MSALLEQRKMDDEQQASEFPVDFIMKMHTINKRRM